MVDDIKITEASPKSLVYLDDLTDLYNRRYLKTTEKDLEVLQQNNTQFSIVIVDIDHFKKINDTYGHFKGDQVIKEFAQFLKNKLRRTDTVVRYGGDEFLCVMPALEQTAVHKIYYQMLESCKGKKFAGLQVMASVGIASYPADGQTFTELIRIADESLYDAKRSGRGRIGTVRKKRIELPTKVYLGRDQEIGSLTKFLREGSGIVRIGIIEGNIGIGKTRLVKDALNKLGDFEVLWSDCLAFFEGISYYPIRELIKHKINLHGERILKEIPLAYRIELGKLVPELMKEIKAQISEVGLVLDKYRLYEAIKRVIELGSKRKVIVIDNMQWIDHETTEIVKYLLRSFSKNATTFLFIYRPEEKTKVLDDFTSSIAHETPVRTWRLASLKPIEIKDMVKAIINDEPEEKLLSYVEQESGGNPYYIEEIIKGLNETSGLRLEGDQWRFELPNIETVPKTIEDIVERRYQALSKEGQAILEIASVIGNFNIEILKGMTGYNEGHIIGMIENIKRMGLVRELENQLAFQDELTRRTIYQQRVSGIKGRMLHKKIGDWLEHQYHGQEQEVLEPLAFHYYHGLDKARGVRYCFAAGDRAKEQYANSSALKYYTWAQELLKGQTDVESKTEMIDSLIRRAEVLRFIGDNDSALSDLDRALKETEEIGDKKGAADIRFNKAVVFQYTSQYREAIEEAQECIKLYDTIRDQKGIAQALRTIGNSHSALGEHEKALKNYEVSLSIDREIGYHQGAAVVLNYIGISYTNLGDYSRALQYFEDALKSASATEDKYGEALALSSLGTLIGFYVNLTDYDRALKYFEAALKIEQAIGNKLSEALTLTNIGTIYESWGDYDRALKYFEDALKIRRDIGDKDGESLALSHIANICLIWGDDKCALKYYEDALGIAETIKASERLGDILLSFGYLHLSKNEFAKAQDFFNQAYTIAKDARSRPRLRRALLGLCFLYLAEKDFEKFAKTIKSLEDFPEEMSSKTFNGNFELLLGCYYAEIKDLERAKAHLNSALKIFEDLKEQLNIGRTSYYLGQVEFGGGDNSLGQKHLAHALEIFNELKAWAWAEKVTSAKK